MSKARITAITAAVIWICVGIGLGLTIGPVHAQTAESMQNIPVGSCFDNGQCWNGRNWYPKPAPPAPHVTKLWKLTGTESTWVVETTGVCIYEAVSDHGIAISAVPKTQLPAGAGCE